MHKILTTPTFRDDRKGLPDHTEEKLERTFALLREHPLPQELDIKKLKGYQRKIFRIRLNDYRLLYTFDKETVTLLQVDQRKDVYK
jgi:addiction module RelE/StbE family toxin